MAEPRKRGDVWYARWKDETGTWRERKGFRDKAATKAMQAELEARAARARLGLVDPRALLVKDNADLPLEEHIEAWEAHQTAKGLSAKHISMNGMHARRIAALIRGARLEDIAPPRNATRADLARFKATVKKAIRPARLADLTRDKVQLALHTLVDAGLSLRTANSHRASIKAFTRWAFLDDRLAFDPLAGLQSYNAAADPRRDRRTLSLEELQRLIAAAHRGPVVLGLPGPARALLYRLAVSTGYRYSELRSLKRESFNWRSDPPTVRAEAGYTKNGELAIMPIPADLVGDLRPHVESLEPGAVAFPLRADKGAVMLRFDLKAANIPYHDESGRVFDFHCWRGQFATMLDAAGASPRTVQRLMRHSTLELSGKYTRPRAADLDAAVESLPSLSPQADKNHKLA